MEPLPLELWYLIASLSKRSDLPFLALVSTVHLKAARWALYQHVSLHITFGSDGEEDKTQTALMQVMREFGLAKWVEKLDLEKRLTPAIEANFGRFSPGPILPLGVLSRMSKLRSLRMIRSPFRPEEYQRKFVQVLQKRCPLLREVEFDVPYSLYEQEMLFPMGGLEKLKYWDSSGGPMSSSKAFSSETTISIFESSSETLKHLIFPSKVDNLEARYFRRFARTFNFPALQTLVLGAHTWVNATEGLETAATLAEFLQRHSTIENLALGWSADGQHYENQVQWDTEAPNPSVVPARFLPKLRTLDAHASQVLYFANHSPSSLLNIVELRLGTGDASMSMSATVAELAHSGGIPGLIKLTYAQPIYQEISVFLDTVEAFSNIFPKLQDWTGVLHGSLLPAFTPMTATIGDVFSRFAGLRRIRVAFFDSTIELTETHQDEVVFILASACPKLERFSSPYPAGSVDGARRCRVTHISRTLGSEKSFDTTSNIREVEETYGC